MDEDMELVETVNEAINNAIEFNRLNTGAQSKALERFSQFYHWYYFSNWDIFAPSKFIGYKGTTIDNYEGFGNGGATQRALSLWFKKVVRPSKTFEELRVKLEGYGEKLGKKICQKTYEGSGGIYLLSDEYSISCFPDEIDAAREYIEGAAKKVLVNAYERDAGARAECIKHYGTICYVCKFDFEKVYGRETGKDFIHVHHIKDLASIGKSYKIDPVNDLKPLCPNCHAMVHKTKPALKPDLLKELMKRQKMGREYLDLLKQ